MNGAEMSLRWILVGVLLVSQILIYQNCVDQAGSSSETRPIAKGNGDIYSGMTYISYRENGHCEDGTNVEAVVVATSDGYRLLRADCANLETAQPLDANQVTLKSPNELTYRGETLTSRSTGDSLPLDAKSFSILTCVLVPMPPLQGQPGAMASQGIINLVSGSILNGNLHLLVNDPRFGNFPVDADRLLLQQIWTDGRSTQYRAVSLDDNDFTLDFTIDSQFPMVNMNIKASRGLPDGGVAVSFVTNCTARP